MTPLVLSVCVSAVLSAEPAAPEESLDTFLERWAGAMAGLETLEVQFRQEKTMRILRRPLVSTGTIRLRVKDQRLRCTTVDAAGNAETEIAVDKGSLRMLYPSLKRMEVYELGSGTPPPAAFPGFGGDIAALKRDYEIARTNDGARDSLRLTPRDGRASVRALTLVLEKLEPRTLIQESKSGDVVKLSIEKFSRNAALSDAALELKVPAGTVVVKPLGAGAKDKEAKK